MSTPKSSTPKLSPLVDSLISRYEQSDADGSSGSGVGGGIDGIVVNDANGLCLVSKGMTTANTPISSSSNGNGNGNKSTGVYTSLTRLASQLSPHQQKLQQQQQEQLLHNNSTEGQTTPTSTSSQHAVVVSAPLITIETDGPSSSSSSSSILIKEYDNKYTVAVRVTSNDDDAAVVKH